MKKLIVLLPLLFTLCVVFGQGINVPDNILDAFEAKYPDAGKVVWKLKNDTYQAQFTYETKRLAYFSKAGKWLKTATMVDEIDLPDAAMEYIMDHYEDAEVSQVQYVIDNKKQSYYLTILKLGDNKIKLKFDDDGKVIV
ncbi:PepSY-like domain-containing protein [Carboxylicivirga sp. RSCT41]|uniref:PepSY-like domain-containing protein n=1 Tax=Carboxylicivirga agarovorans TaxID=3417570 RepID=UPI003D33BED4